MFKNVSFVSLYSKTFCILNFGIFLHEKIQAKLGIYSVYGYGLGEGLLVNAILKKHGSNQLPSINTKVKCKAFFCNTL